MSVFWLEKLNALSISEKCITNMMKIKLFKFLIFLIPWKTYNELCERSVEIKQLWVERGPHMFIIAILTKNISRKTQKQSRLRSEIAMGFSFFSASTLYGRILKFPIIDNRMQLNPFPVNFKSNKSRDDWTHRAVRAAAVSLLNVCALNTLRALTRT